MTDKERKEIFNHRADHRLMHETLMSYTGFKCALADAERRFTESIQPSPSDQGDAEAVLKGVIGMPNFIGSPPIVSFDHAITAMRQFAANEVEKAVKELEPPPSVLDIMRANQHHRATIDHLHSQLSESNAEVERLKKDVELANTGKSEYFRMFQEQLHRTEKLISELSAANQRIAELSECVQWTKKIYEDDGMENMGTRDLLIYNWCFRALKPK